MKQVFMEVSFVCKRKAVGDNFFGFIAIPLKPLWFDGFPILSIGNPPIKKHGTSRATFGLLQPTNKQVVPC